MASKPLRAIIIAAFLLIATAVIIIAAADLNGDETRLLSNLEEEGVPQENVPGEEAPAVALGEAPGNTGVIPGAEEEQDEGAEAEGKSLAQPHEDGESGGNGERGGKGGAAGAAGQIPEGESLPEEKSSPVVAYNPPSPAKENLKEEQNPAQEGESPAVKGEVKESEIYGGYKGPVQGEVKYQEGTPAAEGSREYKASGDISSPYQVELIVTRDYGHQEMFNKQVGLVRDEVGMEVMFRNLDIVTAYGGGFVNSINGLESRYTFYTGSERKKLDWFYWVNGILAPIGVAEYRPEPGDAIWWDYHDWSITMFIPAVIGSYPQPFKSGFLGKNPGTVIMHAAGNESDAAQLKNSLEAQGVKQVDIVSFRPEALENPAKYYIILGVWEELAANSDLLKDINRRNKLIGVYVKFEDGLLKGLDFKGKEISSHETAGAIFAYGSSIGSLNPVWVVTGTNETGYKMALDTLLHNPEAIKQHFGALITADGVQKVPYVY